MKKIPVLISLLLFVAISHKCLGGPGYEISFRIQGLGDSSVYLAYHLGDKQYIRDTVIADTKGSGTFRGDEALPEGIYMIVLPGGKYFELLVPEDQYFSLACSNDNAFNTLEFSGSEINTRFIEYQKNWVTMQQKASSVGKRIQANRQNRDSVTVLSGLQMKQEQNMIVYLKQVESDNQGNLLSILVKAMQPVQLPDFKIDPGSPGADSLSWVMEYNFNRNHYFDNLDLGDERLLRTPLLNSRLNSYFTNVLIQAPDSINHGIDVLMAKTSGNYKVFQYVAVWLFNHFRESNIMGHDAVMVKIADDIYLSGKADWVSQEFLKDLAKQIDVLRPNLIGLEAHNLIMDSFNGVFVALDDIEKDYTILYFWEPNCGFCKESTPVLRDLYGKLREYNAEVFTVCTTANREEWEEYIRTNNLTSWINGWDPERRTNYAFYYNVQTTPLIYILDRNKTIIAKKIGVNDIIPFIENHRKYYN